MTAGVMLQILHDESDPTLILPKIDDHMQRAKGGPKP